MYVNKEITMKLNKTFNHMKKKLLLSISGFVSVSLRTQSSIVRNQLRPFKFTHKNKLLTYF